jgi:hypothetical protein
LLNKKPEPLKENTNGNKAFNPFLPPDEKLLVGQVSRSYGRSIADCIGDFNGNSVATDGIGCYRATIEISNTNSL